MENVKKKYISRAVYTMLNLNRVLKKNSLLRSEKNGWEWHNIICSHETVLSVVVVVVVVVVVPQFVTRLGGY